MVGGSVAAVSGQVRNPRQEGGEGSIARRDAADSMAVSGHAGHLEA
jgi:hypothetical protein